MNKFLKIPYQILLNNELDAENKILLSKIIELDKLPDGCYISNNHLGSLLGINRFSVSKRVTRLRTLGYVMVSEVTKNNITLRRITPTPKWSRCFSKDNGGVSFTTTGCFPDNSLIDNKLEK